MSPQISLAAWEFQDTRHMLELFAAVGADAVEPAPWNIEAVGVEEFGRLAEHHGLGVSCVSTGIDYRFESEPMEDVRASLLRAIDYAAALGAPLVTTYVGGEPDVDYELTIARIHDGMEPCARYAADVGIRILVENVFDTRGDDPTGRKLSRTIDGCRRLMEGLAEFGVSMTFDACNFLVTHQDPWDAFEQLRPYVANLHVKDAIPAAGDVEPGKVVWHDSVGGTFEGVPNGTGDSKLPEIIEAAVGDGFSGPLTIEHVVLDVSAPDTQSKYQAEVDRVRRLVASFAPAGQPS